MVANLFVTVLQQSNITAVHTGKLSFKHCLACRPEMLMSSIRSGVRTICGVSTEPINRWFFILRIPFVSRNLMTYREGGEREYISLG